MARRPRRPGDARLPDERRLPACDRTGRTAREGGGRNLGRGLPRLRPLHAACSGAAQSDVTGHAAPTPHRALPCRRQLRGHAWRSTTARSQPTYTALGAPEHSKERLTVHRRRSHARVLDDYRCLDLGGTSSRASRCAARRRGTGGARRRSPRRCGAGADGRSRSTSSWRPSRRRWPSTLPAGPSCQRMLRACRVRHRRRAGLRDDGRRRHRAVPRAMRDTMVHRGPDGAGSVGVADGASASAIGGWRSSTCPTRRASRWRNEDGTLQARLQRRDLQPRRDPRRARGARRPRLADRPLRHRGHPARLRAVGHRLPPAVPRHVRVRALGRARTASSGWSATASASSRSTTASTTAGSPSPPRSRRCSAIRSRRAASTRTALYHYLSFLTTPAPRHAVRGHPQAAGRDLDARRPRTARPANSATGTPGITSTPLRASARTRSPSGSSTSCARRSSCARSATSRSASSCRAASTRARTRRSSPKAKAQPVKTFSIGYDGDYESYQNELHYARMMADAGRRRPPRAAADAGRPRSTSCRRWCSSRTSRSPIRSASRVYYVSELARDNGVIVCQVGEGADELFWGYPTWKTMLRLQQLDDRAGARRQGGRGGAGRRLPSHRLANDFRLERLRRAGAGQPVFWGGADAFTDAQKHRLLSPRLRRRVRGAHVVGRARADPARGSRTRPGSRRTCTG